MRDFDHILQEYRIEAFSQRDKGSRFERLMKVYLNTEPKYEGLFSDIWLWNEFPSRSDFGGKDTGIDIVCRTVYGDYWAVQCKCYEEKARIDKAAVDTFLSTSSKFFSDIDASGKQTGFSHRLWIDTTLNGFNSEAENTIRNQNPPVSKIGFYDLQNAAVDWQKLAEGLAGKDARKQKYPLKEHQKTAVEKANEYFKENERGKLIMACGTGKTFTSLKIAEKETDGAGLVLFLVPSIALLSQTLQEWSAQADFPLRGICICSDSQAAKKQEDSGGFSVTDLALPASTDIQNIAKQYKRAKKQQAKDSGMIVVFSTYQSIDVIMSVQKSINEAEKDSFIFDLIICDEAHRTTGITLDNAEESAFVKVHSNENIRAKKRLYMTATPRLYSETAYKKADESNAEICSMDDTKLYGAEIYRIGFGEAVDKQLLSDYKVLVLTLDESQMTAELQQSISEADVNGEIKTDDALKLIGCINALSKITNMDAELFAGVDPEPMKSAVAFCQNIAVSKATVAALNTCRDAYFNTVDEEKRNALAAVEARHVDGTMGVQERSKKLEWLKSAAQERGKCNVLMNVRCLSEGVDVPSLDAVMFLSARNSQIDVVQSVGRVMRRATGKKYGYIIIPVVIPAQAEPEAILEDHDRFKVVWTVLNALRAHDDRFNATINKIELNKKKPSKIKVATTNIGARGTDSDDDSGTEGGGKREKSPLETQLELQFERLQTVIYARMVKKCGSRQYWEQWAGDVAKIAERHIEHIKKLITGTGTAAEEFSRYVEGLRKNINPAVTDGEAVEMLAQHIITQPVFEALFENYSFVKNNPVSMAMQGIVDLLNEKTDKEDSEKLERFYVSVRQRAQDIDNAEAKQKIIIELYDKFFRTAFPKVVEKLGIVYTPVEIVDFIIHSIEDVLQKEFKRSMSDENVHILDPFTGTGTFITRLLQSGIIKDADLERKYAHEIHANEIVLLAYYIASINIENVYHDLRAAHIQESLPFAAKSTRVADGTLLAAENPPPYGSEKNLQYAAFNGICLTDTFQLGESEKGEQYLDKIFEQNSQRVEQQKNAPIRIIMGNPPYSIGQKSANDNAQNQSYPKLEKRIEETYVKESGANLNKSAYDSYIKAFRWASDRLGSTSGGTGSGIIAFVSNGAGLDANGLDGFRKCLEREFDAIYVFNLRGNQRTSGELSRKEGGKIFGSGSRHPHCRNAIGKAGVREKMKEQKGEFIYER